MKQFTVFAQGIVILLFMTATAGCSNPVQSVDDLKVGLLLSHNVDDQGWNQEAYQSILRLQSEHDVTFIVKENIHAPSSIRQSVEELTNEEVDMIIGHSHMYESVFTEVADQHPDTHFVGLNAHLQGDNLTGLHFEGYAMGYFAGMLASEMSEAGKIGAIAAFPFQPEVRGFAEGAEFNKGNDIKVIIEFTESWTDVSRALAYFRLMEQSGVDIYYPAGDGFHVEVVEEIKASGLKAIGYVGDQIDLGEQVILTSTVQQVGAVYEYTIEEFKRDELNTGNLYFDFQENAISMGEYGSAVPDDVINWLEEHIDHYTDTGELPHERGND
ncbi:BMP family ABC transporter substrate-binding protein [Salisediminibacterium selenitireducens]|uniref:Basic membrane lipoprotein n=1 Tax=Bacillus selenitireducens (strain ATCC 700615 / DSM 15326 / MLS10) TaxID=439292 RepID=D6XTB0_BACIE|nr:BMP family ABC transporter substrate-binding protein [Salisediminibacterium selenitireducens]ADH99046.1 basic membrane lipoprotein [[Bacillus] selenitireducens MLS10]